MKPSRNALQRKRLCFPNASPQEKNHRSTLSYYKKSGNRHAARTAFPYTTKKSAQPDTVGTAVYRTKPKNLHIHNAAQRRGQKGKSARRGDGLRNYECFPFSQTCPCQSVLPERKIPIHSSLQQQKKCQLIRMPQHPYPTGRNSTVRMLRKAEPDHSLSQEAQFPEIPHCPSRASVQ